MSIGTFERACPKLRGGIVPTEWEQACAALSIPAVRAADLWSLVETDGNGMVTMDEFLKAMGMGLEELLEWAAVTADGLSEG